MSSDTEIGPTTAGASRPLATERPAGGDAAREPIRPACPVCGGPLVEQRGKLLCSRCRTICETCCEGGRG
jgi:hypothetical protein